MDFSSDNEFSAVERVCATSEGFDQHLEKRPAAGFANAADAMDLLKIFALFHNENLSLEILGRAIRSARMDYGQRRKDEIEQRSSPLTHRTSWSESIRRLPSALIEGFVSIGHVFYLPVPVLVPVPVRELEDLGYVAGEQAAGTKNIFP